MQEENILDLVRTKVSEVCDISLSPIDDTRDLFDMGFDSMGMVRLLVLLEELFNVSLGPDDLLISPCVDSIANMISRKRANS